VDDLTTTQGIVALAAAGVGVVALLWAIVLAVKLRRLRAAQKTVLGEGQADLVAHAAQIQEAFVQLRDWVEETATRLEERMATAERRIDGCVAYTSLVRYDAMGEMSGQQSSTMALLDARRTGVVVSSILHRDQARVYVKQVREGESELELSPEEREAIDAAMAGAAA
jgi:ABC-type phosphate transport system auxiliary subunit